LKEYSTSLDSLRNTTELVGSRKNSSPPQPAIARGTRQRESMNNSLWEKTCWSRSSR